MTRHRRGALVGLLVLLGVCAAGMLFPNGGRGKDGEPDPRGANAEPGGTTEAAGLAATQPDEHAWRLFLFLNRQARAGTAGAVDDHKPSVKDYDPDRDVVWETWALASGASEVFLTHGAKPVAWDKLDRGRRAATRDKLDVNLLRLSQQLRSLDAAALRSDKPLKDLLPQPPGSVEVRFNRATFDAIRDNGWYGRDGLIAAYQRAKTTNNLDVIQFPAAAKAVKAAWGEIAEADRPRYHWRAIGDKTYGLLALHVATKDLPLWFWCDFVHADVEKDEPVPSRDATTRGPAAAHGKGGVRDETAGSKWANYRLKGSQVAFTDARGQPTLLGDRVLEGKDNVPGSSCVSCHAMAGIDATGQGKLFHLPVGAPAGGEFGTSGGRLVQTDFLYSMPRRAQK